MPIKKISDDTKADGKTNSSSLMGQENTVFILGGVN